jgi:hypothetical protein
MDYKLGKFDFNPESLEKFIKSNALLYCVVLFLALKIVMVLASINFPYNIFFADITKTALENSANQTRQSAGLPVLVENQKLDNAAQMKAENMLQNNYFSHTSPTGLTPWFWFLQAGYNYKYAGENLAIGFYDSDEVYQAWLNSPAHKANILNPNYKEVGTAILQGFGQNNAIVVVQEFGSQQPLKPVATQPKANPVAKTNEPAPIIANTNTNEKVLSQSTEIQSDNSVTPPNYDKLLQDIIYGVSVVVIGILIMLIFFNFNGINFKRELVFRGVLIVILLSLAAAINKELIISIIPHQVII